MRAVKAHSGVVCLLYVRQRSHAVGKPTETFFGRHSAAQFAAETLVAAFAFLGIAADAIADFAIAPSRRFVSKLNDERSFSSPAFVGAARARAA